MKRSGFKRQPLPPRQRPALVPLERAPNYAGSSEHAPEPKEGPVQHEGYMDAVRMMPCAYCGKLPRSQFCHADEGKGTGIKTDCRRGWPGCAACHEYVGSTGKLGKEQRRQLEAELAQWTRQRVRENGMWPPSLPEWNPTPAAGTSGN